MASQPLSFRHDILGRPNSTASPKDSVLIIIDAQNEYALGKLKVSNVASSRKVIAALLEKYRENGGTNFSFIHCHSLTTRLDIIQG
jgi:nicotinamidase-related amidase